jgi:hypothetical protein
MMRAKPLPFISFIRIAVTFDRVLTFLGRKLQLEIRPLKAKFSPITFMSKNIVAVVAVAFVAAVQAVGISAYVWSAKKEANAPSIPVTQQEQAASSANPVQTISTTVASSSYSIESSSTSSGSAGISIPSNWVTYTDDGYGGYFYHITCPADWFLSNHGVDFVLGMTAEVDKENGLDIVTATGPTISIHVDEGAKLEDIYNGEVDHKVDFKNECDTTTFAGFPAYDCAHGSEMGRRAIFFYKGDLTWSIFDDIGNSTSTKIISTFRFVR